MNRLIALSISILFLGSLNSVAQEICLHKSSGAIAPLGISGNHTHHKRSAMFSYQYMTMRMNGSIQGSGSIDQETILQDYMMAPEKMNMEMHMLMGMYAINDKVTIMGMAPYLKNNMNMTDPSSMPSTIRSMGFGDVSLTMLYSLSKNHTHALQANLGVGIPTGNINESVISEHMGHHMEQRLPYTMQMGSGSWDISPAMIYTKVLGKFALGSQVMAKIRLNENDNGYHVGNILTLNAWSAFQQNNKLSYTLRLNGTHKSTMKGYDANLDPMMSPAAQTGNYGGKMASIFSGFSYAFPGGIFSGHRLAMEYGLPIYEEATGIQMKATGTMLLGWQMNL